eukprot:2041807-Rhodomonas_salina.1
MGDPNLNWLLQHHTAHVRWGLLLLLLLLLLRLAHAAVPALLVVLADPSAAVLARVPGSSTSACQTRTSSHCEVREVREECDLSRLCAQIPDPLQSLHLRRCLLCSQIPPPPHSLQLYF